jgi:hypothetical protein
MSASFLDELIVAGLDLDPKFLFLFHGIFRKIEQFSAVFKRIHAQLSA